MMILKLSSRSIKEINEIRDLQSLELTSNEKDRTGVPREIIGRSLKGPKGFPIIGSLHLLRGPGGPFEAFTNLAKFYGDIYQIQLGTAKCVVVSSFDSIKEVLITKGNHFGGRPDFIRFHQLFGGDRNNCKFISLFYPFYTEKNCLRKFYRTLRIADMEDSSVNFKNV